MSQEIPGKVRFSLIYQYIIQIFQNKSSNIPANEKFRPANLSRILYTLVILLLFWWINLGWVFFFAFFHLTFAFVWFYLIESETLIERDHWWTGYVPATFDLFWLTVLAYITGHITSFFILGYLVSISLSSMTRDRNYGAYNVVFATFLFSAMGFLVLYGYLPTMNFIMPAVHPTLFGLVLTLILSTISFIIVNQVVSKLFLSLNEANSKLSEVAMTDPLTGLPNRRAFLANLENELARQSRSKRAYPIAFIMFDLDHFKKINDTFGHDCGDFALKEFSKVLRQSLRKQDFTARWGGEEFIAILPDTDLNGTIIAAENVRNSFEKVNLIFQGRPCQCTVSSGVSVMEGGELNSEKAISDADKFLYEAKRRGRNCVFSG